MARGSTRTPSSTAYRGAIGRTQTTTMHVTGARGDSIAAQVYTTVDAVSDPELVDRLHSDDPMRALNVVRSESGEVIRVTVPVVYHDPAAELIVLVLSDSHRHRELDERIALLERMRDDQAAIPPYVKDFAVVYGPAGLRNYLERRAQDALEVARTVESGRDLDRRKVELDARGVELDRTKVEQDKRSRELERRGLELESRAQELERLRGQIDQLRSDARKVMIAAAAAQQPALPPTQTSDKTAITVGPVSESEIETKPLLLTELDEIESSLANVAAAEQKRLETAKRADSEGFESVKTGEAGRTDTADINGAPARGSQPVMEFDDEVTTGAAIVPLGSDPLTTEALDVPRDAAPDPWLDKASTRETSSIALDKDGVRIALVASEPFARSVGVSLDIRVLLHRTPHYPVITLVIGPPPAFRVPLVNQLATVVLDIASDAHRAVLATLAKKFEVDVDVVIQRRRERRFKLVAPLAENVGYILRAAEDHLRGLSSSGNGSPAFDRGRDVVTGAGFDLLGTEHTDAAEFRDDKLAQLDTAQNLRRAIAIARRYARPAREDYLVCTRGFPLARWHELRRHVLESAVTWGLWMGPELAQVAVSEGLARSRRDLIVRLDHGFEKLKRHATAFDIDAEAADDNLKAIAEEARALGVELAKNGKNGATLSSDEVSQVSGSIGGTPPKGSRTKSVDDLIAELDDREKRVGAAIELCDRADGRAAAPVIAAVTKMSRAEAVRVLGMSVKFGDAAAHPLTQGLQSSKSFLRHGCALALALLRTEAGTQAVIELLLNEPTEIWREVARAIGQVGPTGLVPLASNFGRIGESAPQAVERVAWAMAHIAVRGGKAAVEAMAAGQSVIAPVARQALELHASAARDHIRVRPGADGSQAGRDVTVNRAFSRRFFEALEQGLPGAAQAGLEALDAASPMELLDEADLIEEDDEAEQLDESDLIQT